MPRADGLFMVGATMIESAERGAVTARSAIELLSAAYALHPAFGEAEIVEMRADVRPAFPDNLPRIVQRGRDDLSSMAFIATASCCRRPSRSRRPRLILQAMSEDRP